MCCLSSMSMWFDIVLECGMNVLLTFSLALLYFAGDGFLGCTL